MTVQRLFEICKRKSFRIGVAESCTGGLLGARLTSVAGSSSYFMGGVIAYSNDVKMAQLAVKQGTLNRYGAVSEEVASEMAIGVKNLLSVEIGLSITGVAGPGAEGLKPEGQVCFGIVIPDGVKTFTIQFGAIGRENVRMKSVNSILEETVNLIS